MDPVRVILVGGFLGSGKTTLLGKLARHYGATGERVALITNDQAPNLVDTELLRRDGFAVGEVSGGCFCCKFDALEQSLEKAVSADQAGVILGEPVGSCTDLSATVLQPLKHLHGDRFRLAPLTVLVDPFRLREAFSDGGTRAFPNSVYYIFHKQLEEADAIAINKSDLISSDELSSLESRVKERFPQTPVFSMSAKTGAGLDSWLAFIVGGTPAGQRIAEVDYDVYAEGEAVLGWLNTRVQMESADAINWDAFAGRLLRNLQDLLQASRAGAAHVKVFLSSQNGSLAANLTGGAAEPVVHGQVSAKTRRSEIVVNARVHMPPEKTADLGREVHSGNGRRRDGHPSLEPGEFQSLPAATYPSLYTSCVEDEGCVLVGRTGCSADATGVIPLLRFLRADQLHKLRATMAIRRRSAPFPHDVARKPDVH